MTNIQKTEAFLKKQFADWAYFREYPADGEYRLQHSYRVAHAAGEIARREGLDEERCGRLYGQAYGVGAFVGGSVKKEESTKDDLYT